MVYPFLPAIARGLGVPIEAVTLAVSARSAIGLAGPFLGSYADMRGRKPSLLTGLAIFGVSLLAISLWPIYPVFFIGLVLSGGAGIVSDSVIYAFIGDHVPYQRRGRVIAFIESGWSLSFLLGIPLVGWLMARLGWSAPFAFLGLGILMLAGIAWLIVPPDPPATMDWTWLTRGVSQIAKNKVALTGLFFSLVVVTANQTISIIYGIWLEQEYQFNLEQIGAASTVIGLAGIAGVLLVAALTDTLGKHRAIALGLLVNSLAAAGLLLFAASAGGALATLFFFYLSFEFILTSAIPLLSELMPNARSTFLATNVAAFSAGDALGALIGPALLHSGLAANVSAVIALNLVALFVLTRIALPKPALEPVSND
jgi:predicted MFS family arabinose efflux permease